MLRIIGTIHLPAIVIALLTAVLLTACGGGGKKSMTADTITTPPPPPPRKRTYARLVALCLPASPADTSVAEVDSHLRLKTMDLDASVGSVADVASRSTTFPL